MSLRKANVVSLRPPDDRAERRSDPRVGELIDVHRQGLRRYLRRRLENWDDVDDVLQETVCRALEAGRFPEVENPGAYLFTIARHIVIDRYRRERPAAAEQRSGAQSSEEEAAGFLASGEMEVAYEE